MFNKLRKDSYVIGILMGVIVPAICFGILYCILALLIHFKPDMLVNKPNLMKTILPKFVLIGIIPSVLLLRYYLLNLKYDKTGRGILISTFVIGIIFAILQFTL
ncbi:MAG: hypothetical protein K6A41_00300 [Bacteroidales bacterium]|nr:hypothetical protein [Bacteroidales bacterium]